MSIHKNDGPRKPPEENDPDELIIDLVEEIEDQGSTDVLSDLEQNLLDISRQAKGSAPEPGELPDLADLGTLEFEEETEDAPADTGSLDQAAGEASSLLASEDMEWLPEIDTDFLSPPAPKPPAAPGKGVTEVADFDEQFLDAEDLLDYSPPASGPETDSAEENETLELVEIEDDEGDDEILWFDDLNSEAAAADQVQEPSAGTDLAASVTPAAAAPDSAPVEPPWPTTPAADATPVATEPLGIAAAAATAALARPQEPSPPVSPLAGAALPESGGLSAEEIEAIVERVITRKLGGSIEDIIRQAIEKAVSKEIERLKNLLLADDPGERPS